MVLVVLLLLFVVLPLVELYVIVQVAGQIGVLWTFASLIAISVLGAWLVKREGLGVLRRLNAELNAGQLPTTALVDGALVLLAGLLCIVPGFVSDAAGLLLLVPPVRAGLRHVLVGRLQRRLDLASESGGSAGYVFTRSGGFGPGGFGTSTVFIRGNVVDTTATDARGADGDDPGDPWTRQLGPGR
ncbi:MAG: FxsA family protein [Acidimicrobiales bacterium]